MTLRNLKTASPREIARQLSRSRRDFLRDAAGVALGGSLLGASPFLRGEKAAKKRKVIVVTFGGGARDQETFAPEGQQNIPHLMRLPLTDNQFEAVTQGQ